MKKTILFLAAMAWLAIGAAQTVLLNEGFSTGIPSNWVMFNDNNTVGSPLDEYLGNNAWVYLGDGGNPGGMVASTSYFQPEATADRWLVTDSLVIPETGYNLLVDAMSHDANYLDGFAVKVSTSGRDSRAAFTETVLSVPAAPNEWTTYNVDLSQFAGQTIYIAIIENSYDKWVLLVDNVKVYRPAQNDIIAKSITAPRFAPNNDDMYLTITAVNNGYDTLHTFKAVYYADSTSSDTVTVTGLNIPFNSTYQFTHPTSFRSEDAQTVLFRALLFEPNGDTTTPPASSPSVATTFYFDSLATPRFTLFEEYSTASCGECATANDMYNAAIANRTGSSNIIRLTHHVGQGTDNLTHSASQALAYLFGGELRAPVYMVNRLALTSAGPANDAASADETSLVLDYVMTEPAFTTISIDNMEYNVADRHVTATINGQVNDPSLVHPNTHLTVYLVEDNIVLPQFTGQTYNPNYVHLNAVRDCLTEATGKAISFNADNTFSMNIDYTVPETSKAWNCRLVAFLHDYSTTDLADNNVLNATRSNPIDPNPVNIPSISSNGLKVYPNPASSHVIVDLAQWSVETTAWKIYDMTGRVMMNGNWENGNTIDISSLKPGVYMLQVESAEGISNNKIQKL